MKAERAEYIQIVQDLQGDIAGRKRALEATDNSDAIVHGMTLAYPYVPYLLNTDDRTFLAEECRMAHRILCKVIARYLDDESYRELFCFPPELERLICLPCGYDQLLPICRFDLFLDEDDFSYKFCEFNADGSGAMSRDLVIAEALMQTESFKQFASHHAIERFELFDTWVEAFMRIYRTDSCAVEHPTVAVTDFEESGVFSDFNRYIAAFERAGIPARFVDTRTFAFDGEHLIDPSDGTIINAIYRRAVTSELLTHFDECKALIDAVEARAVSLIGHFRTTVIHSKMVNIALFDKRTRAFLAEEECAFVDAHVPYTHRLLSGSEEFDIDDVIANKDSWIIKPADDYGAHGVFPGVDSTPEQWEQLVNEHLDAGYIVQEYSRPAEVELIRTRLDRDDPCEVESWQSMPGVYLFDGEPIGMYCRLGQEGVIALDHNGMCACSFKVD